MIDHKKSIFFVMFGVLTLLFIAGCCANIKQMPAAAGTPQIEKTMLSSRAEKISLVQFK